jgi:hypothetical protein
VRAAFLAATSLSLLALLPAKAAAQSPCPLTPPLPNLAAAAATIVPADVCMPSPEPGEIPFRYFDDYSWRTFIALVWPALPGQRGMPDSSRKIGEPAGALVFESYKSDWETFQPNGAEPSEWNSHAAQNPCSNAGDVAAGDLVLGSFNEFGNVGQAGIGRFVSVLVAQNRTYVRYLAAYNQPQFNQIRDERLYLAANVPAPTTGEPVIKSKFGAITVKSSWIDMTNVEHPERFHTRQAWLQEPQSLVCRKKLVGLVGLHIVQKTPTRPQWIWSTFEHVDNVPPPGAAAGQKFTFNNGDGTPMPLLSQLGDDYKIATAPAMAAPPFNVQRITPIAGTTSGTQFPGHTANTNSLWQAALKTQGAGTVWQFYQLTMTQWPVPPSTPANDGTPAHTFPGRAGFTTAFANTTLETFDQQTVFAGCMACHNRTRSTDFIWSLPMNAATPTIPGAALSAAPAASKRSQALSTLRELVEDVRK